jgi:hypothetical protein
MTILTILLVLALAAVVVGTVRATIHDGRPCPPRSHARDRDFLPPSALLH